MHPPQGEEEVKSWRIFCCVLRATTKNLEEKVFNFWRMKKCTPEKILATPTHELVYVLGRQYDADVMTSCKSMLAGRRGRWIQSSHGGGWVPAETGARRGTMCFTSTDRLHSLPRRNCTALKHRSGPGFTRVGASVQRGDGGLPPSYLPLVQLLDWMK